MIETQDYLSEELVAGPIKTRDDAPLADDTYYRGMPLEFVPAIVVGGSNVGDGTVVVDEITMISADIVLTMTAALIAKLTVAGVDVQTGIALPDGSSVEINYKGVKFTLTDGATAFEADDVITISFSTGAFAYTIENPMAVYQNPDARVMGGAGYGSIIIDGDLFSSGLVDGSGTVLVITEAFQQIAEANGLHLHFKKGA